MKLRTKLLVTIISLMLVPLISMGILSMNIIENGIEGQAQLKINGDIGGAHEIFQSMEDKLQIIASSLSEKEKIRNEIYNSSNSKSVELIQSVKKQYPYISSIIITDVSGNVVARSNSDKIGNNLASDPFVNAVLKGDEIKGSAIIPEEELALDNLDSQAQIDRVPTENAMSSDRKVETKGMMIKAGSPIMIDGKIAGSVVIGHLINKDNTIVDETVNAVDVETSTIFMNDLRISAYEPIYDINRKVIGILYVGTPEAPFIEIKKEAQKNLLLIGGVTLMISILLGIYISRKLVKPMDSMYRASDKVANVAQGLTSSVEEINTTIEQISSTTQGIATGANQHSFMMLEISRASKEMLESVQHVAADSQKAAERADEADKTAKEINTMSHELFRLMGEIKKAVGNSSDLILELDIKSQKIGETIRSIAKIAYQTNMLALNASIEAARAGEHGKGFAIVADEVRKLAEESKTAADRVNELIKDIQEKTKNAVESMGRGTKVVAEGEGLIEKTVSSINNISEASGNTAIMFHEIAAASEEQSVSNEEITASVRDVETIIERSAKALQETSVSIKEQTALMDDILKATQELVMLANELENDVVRFNLGGLKSK